jgi:hypothetical protein
VGRFFDPESSHDLGRGLSEFRLTKAAESSGTHSESACQVNHAQVLPQIFDDEGRKLIQFGRGSHLSPERSTKLRLISRTMQEKHKTLSHMHGHGVPVVTLDQGQAQIDTSRDSR